MLVLVWSEHLCPARSKNLIVVQMILLVLNQSSCNSSKIQIDCDNESELDFDTGTDKDDALTVKHGKKIGL